MKYVIQTEISAENVSKQGMSNATICDYRAFLHEYLSSRFEGLTPLVISAAMYKIRSLDPLYMTEAFFGSSYYAKNSDNVVIVGSFTDAELFRFKNIGFVVLKDEASHSYAPTEFYDYHAYVMLVEGYDMENKNTLAVAGIDGGRLFNE